MVSEFLGYGALGTAGLLGGHVAFHYLKGSYEGGMAVADQDIEKVTELEREYAEFIREIDDGSHHSLREILGRPGEAAYYLGVRKSTFPYGEILRARDHFYRNALDELDISHPTIGEYNHALAEGYEDSF